MPTNNDNHVSKFKAKAKYLLKSVRSGDADALEKIQPYFEKPEDFKLMQAQLVIALTHRCNSWKELINKSDWVACSFCGKWQYELKKLIAGPNVYVCNECVELCNEIIRDEPREGDSPPQVG